MWGVFLEGTWRFLQPYLKVLPKGLTWRSPCRDTEDLLWGQHFTAL